ncbi:peptide-methionine (S)-S-oxide reductase MsrA [Allorhodopirellula heiligendammensis]|uniref:Peptide methionine sulfoxide reductase MsrA n=1 Tax=Allorhodopirellula heiligendammensis TaxID=2714739 RepID=A0A5C6BUZ6_9BACT|nr:peptide-methionine (S)-S-oxide reductase MsrA [Allorhodopirellula heiligendammensis]TWU16103.1 Peptide methionine sulfoxide reductase MsrA [Allorhodopirellula heiligendammensis]
MSRRSRSPKMISPARPLMTKLVVLLVTVFAWPLATRVHGEETTAKSAAATTETPQQAVAILAGGCFWCTEAVFERMDGVTDVVSGYIGGKIPNPTYQQVCTGMTGHAEASQIFYDPSKTSYQELLKVFFKTHDPTTLNRQGVDTGTQYRSAIFYEDEEQKKIAVDYIKELDKHGGFRNPIVTTVGPATTFYPAEEYHQDYFRRNPYAAYCQRVVVEKVRKFNYNFRDKIKPELKK